MARSFGDVPLFIRRGRGQLPKLPLLSLKRFTAALINDPLFGPFHEEMKLPPIHTDTHTHTTQETEVRRAGQIVKMVQHYRDFLKFSVQILCFWVVFYLSLCLNNQRLKQQRQRNSRPKAPDSMRCVSSSLQQSQSQSLMTSLQMAPLWL